MALVSLFACIDKLLLALEVFGRQKDWKLAYVILNKKNQIIIINAHVYNILRFTKIKLTNYKYNSYSNFDFLNKLNSSAYISVLVVLTTNNAQSNMALSEIDKTPPVF